MTENKENENENDNRLAPPGEYVCISLTVWMTDLVCNPNPKPNSNIDDVINDVISSDGQKLTNTRNNENEKNDNERWRLLANTIIYH